MQGIVRPYKRKLASTFISYDLTSADDSSFLRLSVAAKQTEFPSFRGTES